jgi:hypothetical protein
VKPTKVIPITFRGPHNTIKGNCVTWMFHNPLLRF